MAKEERPLPRPPSTPFGKKRPDREQAGEGLLADRLMEAAALGKLDEYLAQELPDNEQARELARMMMGMTGMMPVEAPAPPAEEKPGARPVGSALSLPPEEVLAAIEGGDVQGLVDLLRREHRKRTGDTVPPGPEKGTTSPTPPAAAPQASGMPAIDRELIDALIRIAGENSVTLDWIMLRAIKVYVEEYRKTGKL